MSTKYLIFAAALAVLSLVGWLLALQARETVEELETKLKEERDHHIETAKTLNNVRSEKDAALKNAQSDAETLRRELKEAKTKELGALNEIEAKGRQLAEERRQTAIWKGATTAVTRMALKEITANKTARPTPAGRRPAAVPALDPGRAVIIRGAVPVKKAERR